MSAKLIGTPWWISKEASRYPPTLINHASCNSAFPTASFYVLYTLNYRHTALLSFSPGTSENTHTQSIYSIHTPGFSLPSNSWSRSAFPAVTTGPHVDQVSFLFFYISQSRVKILYYFQKRFSLISSVCFNSVLSWLLDRSVCMSFFINNRPCVWT